MIELRQLIAKRRLIGVLVELALPTARDRAEMSGADDDRHSTVEAASQRLGSIFRLDDRRVHVPNRPFQSRVEAANIVFDTGGKAELVEQTEQRQHGLSYGGSWHARVRI